MILCWLAALVVVNEADLSSFSLCGFCWAKIHCVTSGSGSFKLMFGEGIKLTIETSEYHQFKSICILCIYSKIWISFDTTQKKCKFMAVYMKNHTFKHDILTNMKKADALLYNIFWLWAFIMQNMLTAITSCSLIISISH